MGDPHQPRDVYDPARYGEDHAGVYDRIYPSFPTADAVRRIADLAFDRTGPVLDLGIGTGRLALPLTAAGFPQMRRGWTTTVRGRLKTMHDNARQLPGPPETGPR
jgi:hypothetical protein